MHAHTHTHTHTHIHTQVQFTTVGESLSLLCSAGGSPNPLLLWRRGNTIISVGGVLTVSNISMTKTGVCWPSSLEDGATNVTLY